MFSEGKMHRLAWDRLRQSTNWKAANMIRSDGLIIA